MNWTIEDDRLTLSSGATVTFPSSIREAKDVGDVIIVVLEVKPDVQMPLNVFGVSHIGSVLWQIAKTVQNSSNPESIYTGVVDCHNNVARIYNWNGFLDSVDVTNGQIIQSSFGK